MNKEKAHVAQSEEDEPALFMVSSSVLSDVPSFDSKSTEVEVIDDSVTAPMVSVEPEEELQLGVAKAPTMGPRHRGASFHSDRREGRAA